MLYHLHFNVRDHPPPEGRGFLALYVDKAGYLTIAGVLALTLSGCANNPYASNATTADATGGALLGGLAGAIIGNQTGSPLTGAVIGAGIGGIGGYAVGHSNSNRNRYGNQYNQYGN